MRYLILLCVLSLGARTSFARLRQETKIPREVFTTVEQMPSYPGGMPAMMRFINKHIRYPENAAERNIEGKVYLKFIVEPDGSLSNIEVVHGLDMDCDKEAHRVISLMPKWDPGMQNGAFVAVYYVLPITFRLHE